MKIEFHPFPELANGTKMGCITRSNIGLYHVSKQLRIKVIIWFTGVRGEQGAALAVDDLLNKRQFLRHGCWNHTKAGHQGIKRCNSSHHSQVGVKVWKWGEKWDYSPDSAIKNNTDTIKLSYFKSHDCALFTDCSVRGSDTQAAYARKITPPFMNKSSCKQHAYFKKFYRGEQVSVTPVGWIMTLMILCTVGCKIIKLYLDLHCSATRAFVSQCGAFWNGNDAGLLYMPHITCRGFWVCNYATGCLMWMHLHMSAEELCSPTLLFQNEIKCNIPDLR